MAVLPPAVDVLLEQFGSAAFNFLDASVGVWTEDSLLSKWHGEWAAANTDPAESKAYAQRMLDEYMATYQKFQTRILNKDDTLFLEEAELFQLVDAKGKWAGASDQVKDTIWQYLKQIVQSASVSDVYSKCPPKIMDIVTSMASSIVGDVQNGTFDPSQINPMAISQKLMGSLKEDDIKEWGNSLMTEGGMDGLLTMMSSAMGGGVDLSAIASAAKNMGSGGGFPNIDPEMLSTMLGNLGGGVPDIASLLQNFQSPTQKKK